MKNINTFISSRDMIWIVYMRNRYCIVACSSSDTHCVELPNTQCILPMTVTSGAIKTYSNYTTLQVITVAVI